MPSHSLSLASTSCWTRGRTVLALAVGPVAQELNALQIRELEEVVSGLADFRTRTRERGIRVHDFHGRVYGGALFAVVAVLVGCSTARASAFDETVGEEHALYRVVVLLDFLRVDEAGIDETAIDVLAEFVVFGCVGAVPVVEANVKAVEVLLAARGDLGDEGLRRDAGAFGRQS